MDLQLPVQAMPITTKVVSLNPAHGEMHSKEREDIINKNNNYIYFFVLYIEHVTKLSHVTIN